MATSGSIRSELWFANEIAFLPDPLSSHLTVIPDWEPPGRKVAARALGRKVRLSRNLFPIKSSQYTTSKMWKRDCPALFMWRVREAMVTG